MAHRLYMVDVFAEKPYTGNPLAVIVSDEPLPDDAMQQVAAEINFSETTFVAPVPEHDGGYRVRIFTPAREIAFAGHPILGTAWIICHHFSSDSRVVRLNLAVGQVPVTFERTDDGKEVAWFLAPAMVSGPGCDRERVAAALQLSPEDVSTSAPVQVVSAGTSAIIVPLRSLDALARSRLDLAAFSDLAAEGFPPLVYVFCTRARNPRNDLSARFFFEAHGAREDPATGNGAAFLGSYLLEHRLLATTDLSVRIEQGYEIGRPSLIMLRALARNGHREIRVGGQVVPTMHGELL
jgi:trans-2,3-dihydro-3-hydroxyanthranilate isomerase